MISQLLFSFLRPIIYKMDPEAAHDIMIKILSHSAPLLPNQQKHIPFSKSGITFTNQLGLAAGFDKNALCIESFLKLGFGFVEIGTVTPKPQQGNPKPRLFRLIEDQAIINRLGFNNDGAKIIAKRLDKLRHKGNKGIVGVNIGANKDSEDRIADYAKSASYFTQTASYFTVNVSSPNTQGLRNLQNIDYLDKLLNDVLNIAHKHKPIPIFLKIAPDQQDYDLNAIIGLINALPIAGIIASNTTISRPQSLVSAHKSEIGGLSGKPLFKLSNHILQEIKQSLHEDKILIGVGGIASCKDAQEKFTAGADLVQIYSSLIYKGPRLIQDILHFIK